MEREELVERLRAVLWADPDVVVAWLFGSRARGGEHAKSDVDVAVLLRGPRDTSLHGYRFDLEAELAERAGTPVDLVVVNDAAADLVHRVLRDGVLLVERDRSARVRFEVAKRNEYFDLEPLRRACRYPDAR